MPRVIENASVVLLGALHKKVLELADDAVGRCIAVQENVNVLVAEVIALHQQPLHGFDIVARPTQFHITMSTSRSLIAQVGINKHLTTLYGETQVINGISETRKAKS